MAAAVELRPWPPWFQRTWSITNAASRPRDACAQEVAERLEQDFVKDAMDYFWNSGSRSAIGLGLYLVDEDKAL